MPIRLTGFARDTAVLGGSNALAQVLSVLLIPVITRIYDPQSFGVFSVFAAAAAIIGPISTLRYNSALVIPEAQSEADSLAALSIISCTLVSAVVLVISLAAVILSDSIPLIYGLLFPLAIVLFGYKQTLIFSATRNARFPLLASATLTGVIVERALSIGFGLAFDGKAIYLIVGYTAGILASYLVLQLREHWVRPSALRVRPLLESARKYRDFPIYSTASFFANNAGKELPTLVFGATSATAIAGFFNLCNRVLQTPIKIVSTAVSRVYFQRTSRARNNPDRVANDTQRLLLVSFTLTAVPTIVVIAFGPDLFNLIFGPQWRQAGVYCSVLAPAFFVLSVNHVFGSLFEIYGRQRVRLILDVILLALQGAALILAMYFHPLIAVIAYSAVTTVFRAFMLSFQLRLAGIELRALTTKFAKSILIVSPTIVACVTLAFSMSLIVSLVFVLAQAVVLTRTFSGLMAK